MHAKASRQQSSQAEQRSVPAQPGFVGLKPAGPAGLVPGLQHSHGNRFVQRRAQGDNEEPRDAADGKQSPKEAGTPHERIDR